MISWHPIKLGVVTKGAWEKLPNSFVFNTQGSEAPFQAPKQLVIWCATEFRRQSRMYYFILIIYEPQGFIWASDIGQWDSMSSKCSKLFLCVISMTLKQISTQSKQATFMNKVSIFLFNKIKIIEATVTGNRDLAVFGMLLYICQFQKYGTVTSPKCYADTDLTNVSFPGKYDATEEKNKFLCFHKRPCFHKKRAAY